jgi:hypothetical protein
VYLEHLEYRLGPMGLLGLMDQDYLDNLGYRIL